MRTTPRAQQSTPSAAAAAAAPNFGWSALLTALQAILLSLPFVRSLPFTRSHPPPALHTLPTPEQQHHQQRQQQPLHQVMAQPCALSSSSPDQHPSSSPDAVMHPVAPDSHPHAALASASSKPTFDLTALPDELISMCYADLPATDLVSLEHVSRRLRHLIAYDSVCWRRCTETRWGHLTTNSVLLPSAARHAGTWKHLYSEKAVCDAKNNPWLTLCHSEKLAILDLIKRHTAPSLPNASWSVTPPPEPATPPADKPSPLSFSSPISVMSASPSHLDCINIVLLIDASSSVTDDDFDAMKSFARTLVHSLRQTHPNSNVAVVQFNQHPKVEISLTAVKKPKLSTAIDNMEQLMGSTDIAAPIRRAREMLAEEAGAGDRAIVLLTDGQTHADELHESEKEARKAFDQVGARMFTLGVGRDVDESGLSRVAAGSEGGMNFTLRRLGSSK